MKLSEFLAWWGAFNREHCDGLIASLGVPDPYSGLIVFKFAKELVIDGVAKTHQLERATTIDDIQSAIGLSLLWDDLKKAVDKIKAKVTQ
jgi:hypothetical protein